MRAVTAAQMRAIDAAAVAREGEVVLMRRAGAAIAALIERYARGAGRWSRSPAAATTAATPTRRWPPTAARGGGSSTAIRLPAAARPGATRASARWPPGSRNGPRSAPADVLRAAGLVLDGILGVERAAAAGSGQRGAGRRARGRHGARAR